MRLHIPLTATLLAAAWFTTAASGETGNELFQKALVKERAEGNLDEANKLYQQVVEKFSKNPVLVAQSLVAMGQNYQRMGRSLDARAAFNRVLKDFAAQVPSANQARARLAADNAAGATTPATRLVWSDATYAYGTVSMDGRLLSYTDVLNGDLAVRDLTTNTSRRITNKIGGWEAGRAHAEPSVISPDGKWIAYNWQSDKAEVRIISSSGTEQGWGRIFYGNATDTYIEPAAWTPDSQNLVVRRYQAQSSELALLNPANGSLTTIRKFADRRSGPVNVSVSPDARWLAYDIALSGNARDIYVASLDGGAETVAVQDAANDHHPMWSPDGSKLIFVSDRTRNNSLWSLAMSAGKPTGALELLRADLGTFTPFGITQTGAIIYTSGGYSNNIGGGLTNIYIGPLDSDSNPAGEPALATKQFLNSNAFPSWSPDGTRLAYFSQRAPYDTANPIVLVVRDVKSSVETVIPTKLSLNDNQIAWAPDGKSVLVAGALGEMRGLYRVTLETGAEQLLMPTPFNRFSLSSDGKMLYYMKANNVDRVQAIWRRDLATGSEIELKRRPQDDRRPFTSMAVSPDGTEVAYVIRDDANRTGSIEVIPASGGTSREVLRSPLWIGGSPAAGLAWTPDGKNILYAHAEPSFGHFIWRVPAQGGEPVNLGFGIKGTPQTRTAGYMSVNPNGRSIAFTASDQSVSEVWALENILPASSVR